VRNKLLLSILTIKSAGNYVKMLFRLSDSPILFFAASLGRHRY